MDKKMIILFAGAGTVVLGIIIFTIVLITGMQNKPVNIAVTSLTNGMASSLLEGYCGVKKDKTNEYITSGTVEDVYSMLFNNSADVILISEADAEVLNQVEVEANIIARDALVFVNNTLNPTKSLTTKQIKDIYSGKTTDWSLLNGESREVIPYPAENDSDEFYMMNKFMEDRAIAKSRYRLENSSVEKLYEAISLYLDTRRGAIGYTTYHNAKSNNDYDNIRILALDDVIPDDTTIRTGEYPGIMGIYAVIRSDTPENSQVRNFVNYILSQEGQDIISKAGYINLTK